MCLMHTLFSARLVNLCCLWLFYYYCCCCCCCFVCRSAGTDWWCRPHWCTSAHNTAQHTVLAQQQFTSWHRSVSSMIWEKNGTMYSIERNKIRKKKQQQKQQWQQIIRLPWKSTMETQQLCSVHCLAGWLARWEQKIKCFCLFKIKDSVVRVCVYVSVCYRSSWIFSFLDGERESALHK